MRDDFLSHADAAQRNCNLVLQYIRKNGKVSRTDIWNNMNISRASVTLIVQQLQELGLVAETGEKCPSGKRMSRYLAFCGDARVLYVFDWSTRLLCLVDMNGTILQKKKLYFPQILSPSVFAELVMDGVKQMAQERPVAPELLLGLGLALPGIVNNHDGIVVYSVELRWQQVDIFDLFRKQFGDNVFLERTSNAIALGHCVFGAARDVEHVMLFLLEHEGIGLSTVVHGGCQHGSNYMYGELGHTKLPDSTPCSCGQKGCLEAVVRRHMQENGGVVDETVLDYISYGVSAAVNIASPGKVLLHGKLVQGLSEQQEQHLIDCIRQKITGTRAPEFDIHICRDDDLIGIQGIAAYVLDQCFPV